MLCIPEDKFVVVDITDCYRSKTDQYYVVSAVLVYADEHGTTRYIRRKSMSQIIPDLRTAIGMTGEQYTNYIRPKKTAN